MTTEELKSEIAKANFLECKVVPFYSDRQFNTYEVAVKFPSSECQIMYRVKPLDKEGNEIADEFCFSTLYDAKWFMKKYRQFSTLEGWLAMKANNYSRWSCLCTLYYNRQKVKGGEE